MNNVLASLLLSGSWVLAALPAQGTDYSGGTTGYRDCSRESIEQAHQFLRAESRRAASSAAVWGVVGAVSAGYLGAGLSGLAAWETAPTALSLIGVLAGPTGVYRGMARREEVRRLEDALRHETGNCDAPSCPVSLATGIALLDEMRARRDSLAAASTSGLRAGCVIPVILSGFAFYGFSIGNSAGEDLAGLSIGASLVIAIPSLLRYLSARRRLSGLCEIIGVWEQHLKQGGG